MTNIRARKRRYRSHQALVDLGIERCRVDLPRISLRRGVSCVYGSVVIFTCISSMCLDFGDRSLKARFHRHPEHLKAFVFDGS